MIFALFKDPTQFWFSWFSATKIEQHKTKKKSKAEISLFRRFLFSSANFFFDLRVNNRVVVIINYPHKVKNKKHSLINRNKQRKTAFRFACTWSPRVGRDCASHTDKQQKIELTHTHTDISKIYSSDLKLWSENPTHTKISIIRNLLSYCKTFQTNQIHTQTDKKSNGFQSHNQPIFYYYYYYTLIVCYSKMYWIYINDMCL